MYFFLYHLSIADLSTGFGNVLPQLAWEAHGHFYGGNALCKFIKYIQILGPYLSSYVLVMTAIDRYQAICHPLSNSGASNTGSRSRKMIGIAWTIALVSCAPQVFIFSYQKRSDVADVYECWATFPVSFHTRIFAFLLFPFLCSRRPLSISSFISLFFFFTSDGKKKIF